MIYKFIFLIPNTKINNESCYDWHHCMGNPRLDRWMESASIRRREITVGKIMGESKVSYLIIKGLLSSQ